MKDFRITYNFVHREALQELIGDLNGAEGLQLQAGYRHFGKLSRALQGGWQSVVRRTNARFANGENRVLELRSQSYFIEAEIGRGWRQIFVNGLVGATVGRDFSLKASYSGGQGDELDKRLDGKYTTDTAFTGNVGLVFGYMARRFFILLKATYPVLPGNESAPLRDPNPEKVADGSDIFPDDFISFRAREPYSGVPNKFNGLKITLGASFAIRI